MKCLKCNEWIEAITVKPHVCKPQTKPLSDEEINEIKTLMEINYGCIPPLEFAWAIEERHGIK
jgi:arsenate reductase-like glutaredoxin family protein